MLVGSHNHTTQRMNHKLNIPFCVVVMLSDLVLTFFYKKLNFFLLEILLANIFSTEYLNMRTPFVSEFSPERKLIYCATLMVKASHQAQIFIFVLFFFVVFGLLTTIVK